MKSSEVDVIDPVAVCQNYTAELDANGQVVVAASSVDGGSSDNSGSISISLNNNTFNCSDVGTNSVILTVTDPSGNTDTCTAIITVVDNLAPVIDCPSDITVAFDAGQTYFILPDYVGDDTVTATDNCFAPLSIIQSPIDGTQLSLGDHVILFETEDPSGNISSCSFTITVVEELSTTDFEFTNGLSIYPNPSNNEITIESKFEALTTISIVDISGKQIYSENAITSESFTLDISSLSNGIYFIILNNKVTKKIVKI
ncbi:MAG: HYR domain-containing protein [Flavobacteriaceae bacterium]|nr:HYR domain-containing protein [Flavobacteriaceae bacterium]